MNAALNREADFPALEPKSGSRRTLQHDYDMTALSWSPSRLPVLAETLLWAARWPTDRAAARSPAPQGAALDAALAAMEQARSDEELIPAARAFDRVMRHQHYIVPLWQTSAVWIAHGAAYRYPCSARNPPAIIDTWWTDYASPQR